MEQKKTVSITILLPAGRLPLELMEAAYAIAVSQGAGVYLSTAQNLRLMNVPEEAAEDVRAAITTMGYQLKGPGKFPVPRVCVGRGGCNLGLMNPEELSDTILQRFASRPHTKAKLKIAIAACTMCCSNIKTTDIGIMATRDGYEVFAGGKGGPFPQIGRRIARKVDEPRVLALIEELVEFHDRKTEKKQRLNKLLVDADFPFPEV